MNPPDLHEVRRLLKAESPNQSVILYPDPDAPPRSVCVMIGRERRVIGYLEAPPLSGIALREAGLEHLSHAAQTCGYIAAVTTTEEIEALRASLTPEPLRWDLGAVEIDHARLARELGAMLDVEQPRKPNRAERRAAARLDRRRR